MRSSSAYLVIALAIVALALMGYKDTACADGWALPSVNLPPVNLPSIDPGPGIAHFVRQAGNSAADFDQARLDQMSPSPRAGRDFTRIHIKNNTNRTIWVAVRYIPYQDPSTSQLEFVRDANGFTTAAWYELQPNQDAYVGNTANDIFYTFAQDANGGQWAGNDIQRIRDGNTWRYIGFRPTYYIRVADYTLDFQ